MTHTTCKQRFKLVKRGLHFGVFRNRSNIRYRTTPEKTSKTTLNFSISNIWFIAPSIDFQWRSYRGEGGRSFPLPFAPSWYWKNIPFYKWHLIWKAILGMKIWDFSQFLPPPLLKGFAPQENFLALPLLISKYAHSQTSFEKFQFFPMLETVRQGPLLLTCSV